MPKKNNYVVCRDHNGRTCIKLDEEIEIGREITHYLPMAVEGGLVVEETNPTSFSKRYKPMPDYPIVKACHLFLGYAITLGATDEVLDYLEAVIPIAEEDRKVATEKLTAVTAVKTSKKKPSAKKVVDEAPFEVENVVKKSKSGSKAKKTEKLPVSSPKVMPKSSKTEVVKKKVGSSLKPAAEAVTKSSKMKVSASKQSTTEYKSAAEMFRSLISAGKLNDDQIFAAVQEAFGLDDSKRSYVKWYRNDLNKKKG